MASSDGPTQTRRPCGRVITTYEREPAPTSSIKIGGDARCAFEGIRGDAQVFDSSAPPWTTFSFGVGGERRRRTRSRWRRDSPVEGPLHSDADRVALRRTPVFRRHCS